MIATIRNEGFKLTQGMAVKPLPLFECNENEAHTARRDWASFAILIYSHEDMLLSLTDATAFTPKENHVTIRVAAQCPGLAGATIQSVGMIDDDDGMSKADILLTADSVTLSGCRAHQLRLSVAVPADTKPGRYDGVVAFYLREMFGDEQKLLDLDFHIEVHDVLLPDVSQWGFHLDLWQHVANIARKHETQIFSDRHFEILEGYVQSLAELGQKAVSVIASEIPWSGQRSFNDRDYMSDLFEYNMVRIAREADGSFAFDYSVMDRYIRLCLAHGIDREIEVFGLANIWMDEGKGYGKACPDWPDGVRIRYLDHADGCYRYMKEYAQIAGYIEALQNHLEEQGWLGRTLVVADEPADIEAYRLSLDALRKAAPKFRFKTAINHAEFIAEFKDVVADYVPSLPAATEQWDELQDAKSKISGRLLYYVCCGPLYPNNFICSPLAEGRLIPMLAAYLGMDGFLRWNYTVWPENPRERLSYRTGEWWSGDTCFVYPSRGGQPLLSLRYFALKRGIEDYELIKRVAELPDGAAVLETVWRTVLRTRDIRQWRYEMGFDPSRLYSLNWEDYETARLTLLRALERR